MEKRRGKEVGKGEFRFFCVFLPSSLCPFSHVKINLLLPLLPTTHRPRLALGADHRRALGDPPQRLAQVAAPAHERHAEVVLVDVVDVVGRREHLGLVDVVDAQCFQDLRLDKVADARLGHDRDGDGGLDGPDDGRVAHARDAAVAADVGRHALERHHGDGAGLLGDARLLGRRHVHDHALLEHLGEADLL